MHIELSTGLFVIRLTFLNCHTFWSIPNAALALPIRMFISFLTSPWLHILVPRSERKTQSWLSIRRQDTPVGRQHAHVCIILICLKKGRHNYTLLIFGFSPLLSFIRTRDYVSQNSVYSLLLWQEHYYSTIFTQYMLHVHMRINYATYVTLYIKQSLLISTPLLIAVSIVYSNLVILNHHQRS